MKKAWITQISEGFTTLRCTDLAYGDVQIQVAELVLNYTISSDYEPHVYDIMPRTMLAGYTTYVF
jgi:hypothetical protein